MDTAAGTPIDTTERPRADTAAIPLCVDLDGTLITGDLGLESLFAAIQQRPGCIWALPGRLLRGRAAVKRYLADIAAIDPDSVPLNTALVERLKIEARRRRLVLVTGSDQRLADAIAHRLGLFSDVLGSDGTTNLTGRHKAAALAARYGEFDYAGNSRADLPVWAVARRAWVVNAGESLRRRATAPVDEYFPPRRLGLRGWLAALRAHQWAKNLLVFLPLIAAHISAPGAWLAALIAGLALCATATGGYLLNDLMDLQADRQHPGKRRRPLAAGELATAPAMTAALGLPLLGFATAAALSPALLGVVLLYFAGTLSYSLLLKRRAPLDIFVLAGLYGLRVIAGGIAVDLALSNWLLSFTFFVFFSLALLKRHTELLAQPQGRPRVLANRGWHTGDTPFVLSLGLASALASTLLLSIYLHSSASAALYSQPQYLVAVGIAVLGWLSHLWFTSLRGRMDDDPLVFALRDRVSLALIVAGGLALVLAR